MVDRVAGTAPKDDKAIERLCHSAFIAGARPVGTWLEWWAEHEAAALAAAVPGKGLRPADPERYREMEVHGGSLRRAAAVPPTEDATTERLRIGLSEAAAHLAEAINGYKIDRAARWLSDHGFMDDDPLPLSLAALAAVPPVPEDGTDA